ncbi:Nicotinate phosphoribosyltransferase [Diplonema papillatum]|nr:Nicotinate phosphoribosyltransferase [Diplonema papillatum]
MDALYQGVSLGLLTDMYQLTMAQGYWKLNRHNEDAVFHLYFRKTPFHGSYVMSAGLDTALEYLEHWSISASDCDYLRSLKSHGTDLFDKGFIEYLASMKMDVTLHAVPEGEMVFPNEPLLRVEGPLLQCQLLETPLLTILGFQSLVATKASRVVGAASVGKVLDFGLRRAQGPDGGVSMSRAAHIGGCAATSNVLAGKLFDIPCQGTHAHAWVMSFEDEQEAFDNYAETSANNSILLVDTYDTIEGVRRAIETGKKLKEMGHDLAGIRLDSGDLARLSIEARRMLLAAGFPDAKIVASDDLDEYRIDELISRGAEIDVWGVGTRIATCYDQPALGCVYKLAAIENGKGLRYTMKSAGANPAKASIPGVLGVRRYRNADGKMVHDVIHDIACLDNLPAGGEDLLVKVWTKSKRCYPHQPLSELRAKGIASLLSLPQQYRKLKDGGAYPVALEKSLEERRNAMAESLKGE